MRSVQTSLLLAGGPSVKLSELIAAYGDDQVQFQNLDQCAERISASKGVTKVAFATEQTVNPTGTDKLGVVIWLDRDRVNRIIAESAK